MERLDDRLLMDAGFAGGSWTIRGALGPDSATIDEIIVIDRDPADRDLLRATVNGNVVGTRPAADVRLIRIDAGGGNDEIRIDETSGKIRVPTILNGGAGDDRIRGGSGRDRILGGPGDDRLSGDGRDVVRGGAGDDRIDDASGRDSLDADGVRDRTRDGRAAPRPRRFASADRLRRFLVRATIRRDGAPVGGGNRFFDTLPGAPVPVPLAAPADAAPGHSNTNVQVAGVDEADIVKTDGNSLFILSRQELLIVAARPADRLAVASRTPIEGYPLAEYLQGDRLTVVSGVYGAPVPIDPGIGGATRLIAPGSTYSPPRVKVTQFDVSNIAAPRVLQETFLDGSYIDSRATDGKVYVALQNDASARMQRRFLPTDDGRGGTYESREAFQARVRSARLADLAPRFVTRSGGPDGRIARTGLLTDPRNTLQSRAADDRNLLSLVVFDARAAATGPVDSASAVGSYATTLYASKDNLYLLTPRYPADGNGGGSTAITKFALADRVRLAAVGEVPGHVLNQFSVDEFEGRLRIATTVDRGDGARSTNNLYVLEQAGGALAVVGRLENLAPGERIFSARFDGDKGYLVTFEQVDPLFTLDLSNPRAPRVVGELVLPGFSRYLQPIGPGLLLGVGRDADPATGRTLDLQLSLFDVSDPARPGRIAHTLIAPPDQQWSWTDAEYDHHAISYFPERRILTIPVSGSVPGADTDGDDFPDSYDFRSSLYVYRVDPTAGFLLLGTIDHDSAVLRGVRIEGDLYSLAERTLKVNQLDAALAQIGSVVLQAGDGGDFDGGPIRPLRAPAAAL